MWEKRHLLNQLNQIAKKKKKSIHTSLGKLYHFSFFITYYNYFFIFSLFKKKLIKIPNHHNRSTKKVSGVFATKKKRALLVNKGNAPGICSTFYSILRVIGYQETVFIQPISCSIKCAVDGRMTIRIRKPSTSKKCGGLPPRQKKKKRNPHFAGAAARGKRGIFLGGRN